MDSTKWFGETEPSEATPKPAPRLVPKLGRNARTQCSQYPHAVSGQNWASLPANQINMPKTLLGRNSEASNCP